MIRLLNDPSKIVWRSASWALRRLGNRGQGIDAIKEALASPDPATRRGAVRIFAYQFSGMDGRLDLADRLIERTSDPDLWTRLQALRSLRQWFYRSNDDAFRRRVVNAYLVRMAEPDVPVVRKALSEGMYILLDENLGGGVSLQKNLAALPEKFRRNALKGREAVERDVLLGPILAALESGNALQREALLRSFDGSFFKGRAFARQADRDDRRRERPRVRVPLRTSDRRSRPDIRRVVGIGTRPGGSSPGDPARRILPDVPGKTANASIQSALLRGLSDPDPGVRDAARTVVGDDLGLRGLEDDPSRLSLVRASLRDHVTSREIVIRAIARNAALRARPEIVADFRSILARENGALTLLPVLGLPAFTDLEVLTAIHRSWPRADRPEDRLGLFEALVARPNLLEGDKSPSEAVEVLKSAVSDPSARVRERALEAIGSIRTLREGKVSNGLLLTALADDTPALRWVGLKLAADRPAFWTRPDARERLLALLIDPDARVRDLALACVERHRLVEGVPSVARRVKALADDPALKVRAEAALSGQGFDPRSIEPDLKLRRPRLLGLSTFRDRVNPLFYQPGEDGYSCARCHATHNVLRIAEVAPGSTLDDPSLLINYNSVLKVVNRGEAEASLLLRKPRSPQGQGGPDPASPTGLTHVGGPRWEGADHPAYRAILDWLREASRSTDAPEPRATADGHASGFEPGLATDGDPATYWQTEFVGANPAYPHELTLDLGSSRRVDGLLYVPRQDSSKGRVKDFEIRVSEDGRTWSGPIARGNWPDDPADKFVALPGRVARFVQFRGLSEVNGLASMSAAELAVDSSMVPSDRAVSTDGVLR